MKAAARLVAHGRVQGVGFRWFACQEAGKHGLYGWVRNLPNGDVEIFAEGTKEHIEDFIARIQKGPSFSHVQRVITEWHDYQGRYDSFKITF